MNPIFEIRNPKFRKLWIGLAVLILLTPLGLALPGLFNAGGAWGEWGVEEIRSVIGYVPEGLRRLSEIWSAPLRDYALSGWDEGMKSYLSYLLSGLAGVLIVAVLAYVLGRILKRGER